MRTDNGYGKPLRADDCLPQYSQPTETLYEITYHETSVRTLTGHWRKGPIVERTTVYVMAGHQTSRQRIELATVDRELK